MARLCQSATEAAKGLFDYNRQNFLEDREQRQSMEYQVMEMRIKQTQMWRDDVRKIIEFTQTKVEMYMLVSTLLLGFCATAIVKAVVVEGTPSWLATAHTLMLMGAFMFLLISMILGINAYVASQAYAVRLLTQFVRLPIPTWKAIEASRTYGSTYEKQRSMQMFRTPFAMGKQENLAEDPRRDVPGSVPASASTSSPQASQRARSPSELLGRDGNIDDATMTADPWGLERRGDDIPELHPLVNVQCERQRHIWLAREAGKYYLTHEAFCRVSMNLGTSYLALFFSYYCLTYCLVEDGAPAAAFGGMVIFVALSLIVVFMDKLNNMREMLLLCGLQAVAPVLSAICTYKSMPDGYGGIWEYIVCIGQFTQGLWLLVYLNMLRVRETDTGVFFPMGFKTTLLLDTFGRHPHRAQKKKGLRQPAGKLDRRHQSLGKEEQDAPLPALTFVNGPFRPEDLNIHATGVKEDVSDKKFSPDSFFAPGSEEEERGNICHGAKPGEQVWSVFKFAVWMLTAAWWVAGSFAFYEACIGDSHFTHTGVTWETKAEYSHIVSVALQFGSSRWRSERIQTSWPSAMARPQGLACDPSGTTFATFGRGRGGHRALLHGRVSEESAAPPRGYSHSKLAFATAPSCPGLDVEGKGQVVQDLALHKCADMAGCAALVLPKKGLNLVSCRLEGDEPDIMDDVAPGLGLFQRQAIYRRINKDDTAPNVDRVVMQESFKNVRKSRIESEDLASGIVAAGFRNNASVPLARAWLDDLVEEEPSSLSVAPCPYLEGGPSECPILGTTLGRVVQLAPGRTGDGGQEAWVPRSVLLEDRAASQPGSILDLGGSNFGVLQRDGKALHMIDSSLGASKSRAMRLPKAPKDRHWASVCAGGGSVYALESGEDPVIWRFTQN